MSYEDSYEPYENDIEDFELRQLDLDGDEDEFDDEDPEDDFADPDGNSALRAATSDNPRVYPCPTCDVPNRLTPKDVAHGYQCNACADRVERGW